MAVLIIDLWIVRLLIEFEKARAWSFFVPKNQELTRRALYKQQEIVALLQLTDLDIAEPYGIAVIL